MADIFSEGDLRKALFTPCETRDDLKEWIHFFLGFELPDCTVDLDSNANPMAVVWEVYNAARLGSKDLSRLLAYSCRDGFKTMLAAMLEVLSVVHLDRNVAHMAAIESQASKAQNYVKEFFGKLFLRDYVTTQNERRIEFEHYFDPETGEHLTTSEFWKLTPNTRSQYQLRKNYIQIIICTMAGANSEHVPFFVVDEVDVVQNPRAYKEAKYIPSRFGDKNPITLLVSTRKTGIGLVQKEIDDAEELARKGKTGAIPLQIRHWNAIDITEACPPERHEPEKPRVNLYYSDEDLHHVIEADYELLDVETKKKYVQKEAYAGCVKCPLFSVCKTRLATEQKSKSDLLKTIPITIQAFAENDVESAIAQLMSRKPPSTGLIYKRFDRNIHMLTPRQMAEKITGEQRFDDNFNKADLVLLMKSRGMEFFAGLDWGFTHNFVIVSGAKQGMNIFIFDVITVSGLDPEQKLTVAEKIKWWNPRIFADPEAPDQIKLFKKKGFDCKDWSKKAGSVKMGIDVVRMKLRPAIGPPTMFIMMGDASCDLLATRLAKYHFKFDAAGEVTDVPSEEDDDEADAVRYLIMNTFAPHGTVTAPEDGPSIVASGSQPLPTQGNYLSYYINEHLGKSNNPLEAPGAAANPAGKQGKKGRLFWNFD